MDCRINKIHHRIIPMVEKKEKVKRVTKNNLVKLPYINYIDTLNYYPPNLILFGCA